ncbi:hypothetical protein HHX47_DHR1002088 [Lentinula edodes]|nr:hypothetical protein HHX47_DHR1002088 [Lentinula edodes]
MDIVLSHAYSHKTIINWGAYLLSEKPSNEHQQVLKRTEFLLSSKPSIRSSHQH